MPILLLAILAVLSWGAVSLAVHTPVFLAKVGLFVIVGALVVAAVGVIGAFVSGKKGRE
jgi:uncharacterized membrane protein